MKLKRILLVLLVAGILVIPSVVNAKTLYYTGKAYVDSRYRYVGFTPEKIVIKTNVKWHKSIHHGPIRGSIQYKTLNIKLYSWGEYPRKGWFLQDEKTYHNEYSLSGGLTHEEFKVEAYSYCKHWWDNFIPNRRYVKYIIHIPKDIPDFYHHNSGKTKIVVTLKIEGAEIHKGPSFEKLYVTVKGTGTYWTKPCPLNKYRQYWGSSASVNIANLDEAPSPNAYILSIDNETSTATFTMQPLTVEETDDTVNERVLLLGGALIVACVAVLIVMSRKK